MMARCFKLIELEGLIREGRENGSMSPWRVDSRLLELPATETPILERVLKPFDLEVDEFMDRLNSTFARLRRLPWAILCYDREYRLAGHLETIRDDPAAVPFTYYSAIRGHRPGQIPKVSIIFAMTKAALSDLAAHESPLTQGPWRGLKDKSPDDHWCCICDPLPKTWVSEQETVDETIYRQLKGGSS